jgi:hypothetical protein
VSQNFNEPCRAPCSTRALLQVHIYCKQLSKPILTHTLTPSQMPASSSYFTLATVWKPHSMQIVASLSTGSCHILSMVESET